MELAEPDGLIHHQYQVSTGLTLHAVERPGKGEPMFLLHGIWGTWRSWLPLLQAPTNGPLVRPLIALDLRGHGFSDKPQTGYTLSDYAADVVALFDSLGIEQATVIGHSLGSLVSLEIAATNADRICTLVLEEPTLPLPDRTDGLEGFWESFVEALFGLFLLKHEPHEVIVDELMVAAEGISREAAEEGAYSISHTSDGVFADVMEGKISTTSFDHLQQPLEIPTLIFQGSRSEDRALSDDGVEMLRRILAEPRIVTLPETGHTIHSSQPEAYQRALVEFLDR
jgi:pimeloyl-ACP methyl ester carboxylesterase